MLERITEMTTIFERLFPEIPPLFFNVKPQTDTAKGMKILNTEKYQDMITGKGPVYYSIRNGHKLSITFFTPSMENLMEETNTTLPLIIFVQGSGFLRQDLFQDAARIITFAKRGFAIAIVELTGCEDMPFPASVIDLKAAIRACKASAKKLNIDPDKIVLWGESSGAFNSVFAGLSGEDGPNTEEYSGYSSEVKAIVDFYGLTDMLHDESMLNWNEEMDDNEMIAHFIGKETVKGNEKLLEETNPLNFIKKGRKLPPVLIMHGNMDVVVTLKQSVLLYEALRDTDHEVEFYMVPGAGHSTGEFWSDSTFDVVEKFIKKYI